MIGDRIAPVAMAFAILGLTHSARDLGIVLAAQTIPMALMLLPAGVIADRLPRRGLLLSSDLIRLVTQAITAGLLFSGHAPIWALALTQAIWGFAEAFFLPAVTGLMPELVAADSLQPANALMSLGRNVSSIIGPVIAAAMIAASSAGAAMVADAASFGLSALLIAGLPKSGHATPARALARAIRGSFISDLKQGTHEVFSRPWLRTMIVAFAAYHVAIMPAIYVLGPLIATSDYGGAPTYAFWISSFGIGAIGGGLLALRLRPRFPMRWVAGGLMVAATQPLILGAGAPSLAMGGCFVITGISVSYFFTVWDAAVQGRIPAESLARVASFDFFGSTALLPIGYALAGPFAATVGTRAALLWIGAFGVLSAASTLLVGEVRQLRASEGSALDPAREADDAAHRLP